MQAAWLKLCGDADPQKAKRENEFALRAIFGTSASSNALHASGSYSAALSEAELLFPEVGKGETVPQGDAICGAVRRQVVLGTGEKSLKEVVLVVLCCKVLEEDEHYGVIDSLMREDFRLINMRQTWLSTKQSTELAGALGHRCIAFACSVPHSCAMAGSRASCSAAFVGKLLTQAADTTYTHIHPPAYTHIHPQTHIHPHTYTHTPTYTRGVSRQVARG